MGRANVTVTPDQHAETPPPSKRQPSSRLQPLAGCRRRWPLRQWTQHGFSAPCVCPLSCSGPPGAELSPPEAPSLPCWAPHGSHGPSASLRTASRRAFKVRTSSDVKFNKLRMTHTVPAILPSFINSPLHPFLSYCFTYYSLPNKLSLMLQHQTFIILSTT